MSNILNDVLNIMFGLTNDWGMAIVALTILVKVIMLPLSIKQKIAMSKQQKLSSAVNEINKKYKNNEEKKNEALKKCYKENSSSLLGFFIVFLQLPILIPLFNSIKALSIETGSALVPWVSSLKVHDSSYIIPIIYSIVALGPSLLNYIGYLKGFNSDKPLKQNIITTIVISIMLTFKSPVVMGIYLITSGVFSILEEMIYRFLFKSKCEA